LSAETPSAASESPADRTAISRSPKKKPRAAATSGRKTGGKKKSATDTPTKRPAKRTAKSPRLAEPTDAEIQVRAYFLAERRIQQGLQGDSAHDWIEAKKQLTEETREARP